MFNRALSAAEIAGIYAAGSAGMCHVPQLFQPACVGTNFAFSFQTASNAGYTVEYNDDLRGTNWQILEIMTGDGSLMPCLVPMTNTTQRFFRVRQP